MVITTSQHFKMVFLFNVKIGEQLFLLITSFSDNLSSQIYLFYLAFNSKGQFAFNNII